MSAPFANDNDTAADAAFRAIEFLESLTPPTSDTARYEAALCTLFRFAMLHSFSE